MEIKTIVAAVDLDDDLSDPVIRTAVAFAERFGAKLHVIDAWPPLKNIGYPYARKAAAKTIRADTTLHDQRKQALEAKVSALEPRAITMAPVGDAPDAIITYARNEGADLLVIGSHQKGLFERITGGASSAEIIHDAPCGVLLVTPGLAQAIAPG